MRQIWKLLPTEGSGVRGSWGKRNPDTCILGTLQSTEREREGSGVLFIASDASVSLSSSPTDPLPRAHSPQVEPTTPYTAPCFRGS